MSLIADLFGRVEFRIFVAIFFSQAHLKELKQYSIFWIRHDQIDQLSRTSDTLFDSLHFFIENFNIDLSKYSLKIMKNNIWRKSDCRSAIRRKFQIRLEFYRWAIFREFAGWQSLSRDQSWDIEWQISVKFKFWALDFAVAKMTNKTYKVS